MKLTMLGHASLYVETDATRILIDPVLIDPQVDGVFSSFPARTVDLSRMPPHDVIVISHQHLDHFDVDTLALLDRDAEVLFPKDPLIDGALARLGFQTRIPLADWTRISYPGVSITTTPSLCPVPEFGMIIDTGESRIWNQVDTLVDEKIIAAVMAEFPDLDLILAPWQPMLESAYAWNRSMEFPYQEYARILERIRMAAPTTLVPGANGFCYAGRHAWLNQLVFPVHRDRFCEDVRQLLPDCGILPLDPGDRIALGRDGVVRDGRTDWVASDHAYDLGLAFRPNLLDRRPRGVTDPSDGEPPVDLEALIERLKGDILARAHTSRLDPFREWGVMYELEIDNGDLACLSIDFGQSPLSFIEGPVPTAQFRTSITARALQGLMDRTTSWSAVIPASDYRLSSTVGRVRDGRFQWPSFDQLSDVLWAIYPHEEILEACVTRKAALPMTGSA